MSESEPPPAPFFRSDDLRRNVELKAKLKSLVEARTIANGLATEYVGRQRQTDTYFHSPHGRLKLRVVERVAAQLIWYERADQAVARSSQYYLLDVTDPQLARQLLATALGIRLQVVKEREIFLYHNVRIHLDDVTQLGAFLEFEAVMAPGEDLARGHEQLAWLCQQFGVTPASILAQSYVDLLAKQTTGS